LEHADANTRAEIATARSRLAQLWSARRLLGRRELAVRVGAGLILACAIVVLLIELPGRVDSLSKQADSPKPLVERSMYAAYSIDIDRGFLLAARQLLPRNATFLVETGPNTGISTPVTLTGLPSYASYFLLPRRQILEDTADWLLCYGCDLGRWKSSFTTVWDAGNGLVIARHKA
jgi:hypothetical protein